MGYEDDPYRDEDGEPLMDYDDVHSDREASPDPNPHVAYLDDFEEEDGDAGDLSRRDRSQTPVYDNGSGKSSKPRKRLIKKGGGGKQSVAPELEDEVAEFDEEDGGVPARYGREGSDEGDGRKRKGKEGGSGKKDKRHKGERRFGSSSGGSGKGASKFGGSRKGFAGKDDDGEVKEMWDTIAGGDSEV